MQGDIALDKKYDVALVVPPITDAEMPSLAMSLFKSCFAARGIKSYVEYADLHFYGNLDSRETAELIKQIYHVGRIGEYMFLPTTGWKPKGTEQEYYEFLAGYHGYWNYCDIPACIEKGKAAAKKTVEDTARRVVESGARVVGAVMQFQQLNGAASILKRIKELDPTIVTMVGGGHCMDIGGRTVLRHWDFVDYVFFGEADEIIGEICEKILAGEKDFPLPYGVLRHGEPIPEDLPHRRTQDMNKVPYPDFDDYFALADAYPDLYRDSLNFTPNSLVLEGSRGCWWGEKGPCTFCGLNGRVRVYRDKDPERFAEELAYMAKRWPQTINFKFSDNIQSFRQTKELPTLMKDKMPRFPILMTEIKSNLKEEDMRRLASVGFRQLQPGIESLHDDVLEVMHKGNRGLDHIALLRYARKLHIYITWNFLYGFPGEPLSAYEEIAEFLPMIFHLQPPSYFTRVIYQRNNVYYNNPEKYGLDLCPAYYYRFVMPDNDDYVWGLAYNFDDRNAAKERPEVYDRVEKLVQEWRLPWMKKTPERLEMELFDDKTEIRDTRMCSSSVYRTLNGLTDRIYRRANVPVRRESLTEEFGEAAQEVVDELLRNRLMMEMKGRVLALATETNWKSCREETWLDYLKQSGDQA